MLFYTVGQSQIFLAMIYAGMFIALLYDILRLIRYILTAGRVLTLALDLVFGALSAFLLIAFMMKANYVELRVYALLGALCGFVLYEFTISPIVMLLYRKIKKWLIRFFSALSGTKAMKKILK